MGDDIQVECNNTTRQIYRTKKKKVKIRRTCERLILYIIIVILAVSFFLPFFLTFMNSLKPIDASGNTAKIIPEVFHWENYHLAVTLIPFFKYLRNSLILVVINLCIGITVNLLMGYAFARLRAPGKNIIFTILLSTMMIPGIVTMIPQYILFNRIGLVNSYWLWAIWAFGGSAFNIFLFRQYFASMPKELEEAAKIDGCSTISIIFRIFVPSAIPVITIVAFGLFNWAWNDYMNPFMYLSQDKYPLAMALFGGDSYKIEGSPNLVMESLKNCAAILIALPAISIFFICQKYIVEGIVTTGLKG